MIEKRGDHGVDDGFEGGDVSGDGGGLRGGQCSSDVDEGFSYRRAILKGNVGVGDERIGGRIRRLGR